MVICDFPNGYLDADPQGYFETKRQWKNDEMLRWRAITLCWLFRKHVGLLAKYDFENKQNTFQNAEA